MGCPYSEESLQEFDGVSNPMGDACYDCSDTDCEHYSGPDDKFDEFYGVPVEEDSAEVVKEASKR